MDFGKTGGGLRDDLAARFTRAGEEQEDELDFFLDLMESGVTLEDIRRCLPERYEYSREFCEEHGLV